MCNLTAEIYRLNYTRTERDGQKVMFADSARTRDMWDGIAGKYNTYDETAIDVANVPE
jgi:hypothetical protein